MTHDRRSPADPDAKTFADLTADLPLDALADHPLGATIDARTWTSAAHDAAGDDAALVEDDDVTIDEISARSLPTLAVSGDEVLGQSGAGHVDLEVLGTLGEGGMGVIKRARQCNLQREVAVKTLRGPVDDPRKVAGLLREGVLTGQLEHPNVIPVHTLGRAADDQPVLVMKRVEGVTWTDILRDPDHAFWEREDADTASEQRVRHLEILVQVCRAVEFAHSRGVIHRDIKPDNVMVGSYGEVYLVDWGVAARQTQLARDTSRRVLGTPMYMAPEMAGGDPTQTGPHSDIYLLGATLYEILTGHAPHANRDGLMATLLAAFRADGLELPTPARHEAASASATRERVDNEVIDDELAAIVRRATMKDPAARYASAAAFRQALQTYLRHRGSIALTRDAETALAELEAAIEAARSERAPDGASDTGAPSPATDADTGSWKSVLEPFTRAQLGFQAALRDWPENARARDGLQRCLERMIGFAVERENAELAETLLPQLPRPRPELEEAVEAAREARRKQREASEELRILRREHDVTQRSRGRNLIFLFVFLVATAISVGVLITSEPGNVTVDHSQLVFFMIGLGGVSAIVCAIGWRRWFINLANRRMVAGFGVAVLAMLANRLVGWALDVPPLTIMLQDLIIETAVSGVICVAITWRFLPVVACFIVAIVAGTIAPRWIPEAFSIAHLIGPLAVLWLLSRRIESGATGEGLVRRKR